MLKIGFLLSWRSSPPTWAPSVRTPSHLMLECRENVNKLLKGLALGMDLNLNRIKYSCLILTSSKLPTPYAPP